MAAVEAVEIADGEDAALERGRHRVEAVRGSYVTRRASACSPRDCARVGCDEGADRGGIGFAEGVELAGVDRAGDEEEVHAEAGGADGVGADAVADGEDLAALDGAAGGLARRGAGLPRRSACRACRPSAPCRPRLRRGRRRRRRNRSAGRRARRRDRDWRRSAAGRGGSQSAMRSRYISGVSSSSSRSVMTTASASSAGPRMTPRPS